MWFEDAIIYQVFPDRFYKGTSTQEKITLAQWEASPTTDNFFGGDLRGILAKIEHLKRLGINTLLLNPIFKAATNHRYDIVDYYQIDPLLGSNDEFMEFMKSMHQQGIRVILDGVFNHCGINHPFFQDVIKKEKASPYRDWFEVEGFPITSDPLNYQTCGGCHYLPKFNFNCTAIQEYLLDAARYWTVEYHIDGWRLDSAQRIPPTFWKSFQAEMQRLNPNIFLSAELWHDASQWFNAGIFDSASNYPLREVLFDFLLHETIDGEDFLYEVQRLYTLLGENAHSMLNLLGCHDTPRIATLFERRKARRTLAILLQFCLPGIPHIYYGDEIGLLGADDPGCRHTMPWDENEWDMDLFQLYRDLTWLRRQYRALRAGSFTPLRAFNHMIAFKRTWQEEEIIFVLNRGKTTGKLTFPTHSNAQKWKQIYPETNLIEAMSGTLSVEGLEPDQARIFRNA